MDRVLFSRKSDDWSTPKEVYDGLDLEFGFDFDPCPLNSAFDGLSVDWGNCNFVNPPFSKLKDFLRKGFEEWRKGKTVVFLIPARTDTKAFHEFIVPYAEVRFIKGRLKFGDGRGSAPFPSIVCVLRAK